MSKVTEIIIVDDEKLFRRGLRHILQAEPSVKIVASAGSGRELLLKLKELKSLPNIILLDLKMKNLNGVETTKILRKEYPEIKIAILSLYYSPEMVRYMISLGVSAFFRKTIDPDELKIAITNLAENENYLTPYVLSVLKSETKDINPNLSSLKEKLTNREIEVLILICKQYTNSQIADKLFVSVRTIDGHRHSLLSKTNSRNTAGLVVFALANDYINYSDLELLQ